MDNESQDNPLKRATWTDRRSAATCRCPMIPSLHPRHQPNRPADSLSGKARTFVYCDNDRRSGRVWPLRYAQWGWINPTISQTGIPAASPPDGLFHPCAHHLAKVKRPIGWTGFSLFLFSAAFAGCSSRLSGVSMGLVVSGVWLHIITPTHTAATDWRAMACSHRATASETASGR